MESNYLIAMVHGVPLRIVKIKRQVSSRCFRNWGQEGSMVHIWYRRPKIRKFGIKIFVFKHEITKQTILKSPETALSKMLYEFT